jgi:hypothetical protein
MSDMRTDIAFHWSASPSIWANRRRPSTTCTRRSPPKNPPIAFP